jgi:hypothetical protein
VLCRRQSATSALHQLILVIVVVVTQIHNGHGRLVGSPWLLLSLHDYMEINF